jgi:uncharacterized protein YndB with AHSA1/START domain
MPDVRVDPETTLVLRRTYAASRERVFDAWLDPKMMHRFIGPEGCTADATVDARVGGAYRIVMHTPDGEMVVRGTYDEIRRPDRIGFSWAWDEDDAALAHTSHVTLEFLAKDGGTELVLTHERLRDAKSRDSHAHGWSSIIENLDAVVR